MPAPTTLRDALHNAALQLVATSPQPQRDAELLLLHTLYIPRTEIFTTPTRPLSAAELAAYTAAITRRAAQEPIQYITNTQEFFGRPFHVTPAVLIPRPETELLIDAALAQLPRTPIRLADVGTGSGIIAITLALELPLAEIHALDISPAALTIARKNAHTHHADHIHFHESDLLAALPPTELFDAILSNPPYVSTEDRETLAPEVRNHEPAAALFAGPTGLTIYQRLIPQAFALLKPNGLLALEIGYNQRDQIAALLTEHNFHPPTFIPDLQQIPRVAVARKP